jgi:predicted SprT family Zn-dependent metalloprotease
MMQFPGMSTDRVMLVYLGQLWNKLNREKFGEKLKLPHIRFLKDQKATKMRCRGKWQPGDRCIAVARRLFNNEKALYETFLHEMCHQAVSEIDKIRNGGHGYAWCTWMRKVGLPPRQYDHNDNTAYMSEHEKKAHVKKVEERKALVEQARQAEKPVYYPQRGMAVKWLESGSNKWREGVCVAVGDSRGRWAVATGEYETTRWALVPPEMLYAVKDVARFGTDGWRSAVGGVEQGLGHNKMMRSQRREMRARVNMLRSLYR